MADQVSSDVKKFFHGYAADFDSIYGHTETRSAFGKWVDKNFRQTMFLRFEEVLKNTGKDEIKTVLDVGCGPGRYIVEFLLQGKDVTGLDLADGMVQIAKKVADGIDYSGKLDFVVSGYMEHEFAKQYDAACLMGFFDYIEKPEDIVNKLKKDVSKEFYMSFPIAGGLIGWQREVRYKMRNCPLYMYTKADVIQIMDNCGLQGKYEILDFGRDYFVKVTL
jgi:SAM-dependent methyltransferase